MCKVVYGICTLYVLLYIYTMYVKALDVLVCIWLKLFAKLSARIVAFIPLPKKNGRILWDMRHEVMNV